MTTPSSHKSNFMTYFRYRLRSQITFLIITSVLSILSVVLFSTTILIDAQNREMFLQHNFLNEVLVQAYWLAVISAVAMLALSLFGGMSAFNYCLKKECTDTFYSLPVTQRERFWADLLSGYISRVAPLIPCCVISMIMSIPIDKLYTEAAAEYNAEYVRGMMTNTFVELNLMLFFAYTFAYLLSVIVSICCGRKNASAAYTCVLAAGFLGAGYAVNSYIVSCLVGVDMNIYEALKYMPPLGLFFGRVKNLHTRLSGGGVESQLFSNTDPAVYIIFAAVTAALAAAAYFLFKHRRPENTGRAVASKNYYNFFAWAVTFCIISLCCHFTYGFHNWWLSALISLAAGMISLLIFTLAGKTKRSKIPRELIRSLAVAAGSVLLLFIVDKTAVFGARYLNISPDKIQRIYISMNDHTNGQYYNEELFIDQKDDIEQFIAACNKTLKDHSDDLFCSGSFTISCELTNGKTVQRGYDCFERKTNEAYQELLDNVRTLPNYPIYAGTAATRNFDNEPELKVSTFDKFGQIAIPENRVNEFKEIFTREIREKYDQNSSQAGIVRFNYSTGNEERCQILSCYTDTLAFAESFRVYDSEEKAFSIMYYKYDNSNMKIDVDVKMKNLDHGAGKELASLLKPGDIRYVSNGGFWFMINSGNGVNYYVPEENIQRAVELMMDIIEENYAQ